MLEMIWKECSLVSMELRDFSDERESEEQVTRLCWSSVNGDSI